MTISERRELISLQEMLDVCKPRLAIDNVNNVTVGKALGNLKLEGLDEILLRNAHYGYEHCECISKLVLHAWCAEDARFIFGYVVGAGEINLRCNREMTPFRGYQHCVDSRPGGIDCTVKVHLPPWTLLLIIHLEDPFVWKVRVDRCVISDWKLC
ncbi:hypothetical protein CRG98_023100 [Punica granatum]|uniref:Uncharacterized protein n=1 Tax=Punica granatum TaxID=22663 RepID=A0A2I0JJM0_PUNGR|nr:hypothetical protein CRG98_023100 [Punica granatum]